MVYVEGLIDEDKLGVLRDRGYDILHVYHTVEEAQKAEPGNFDDDSAIGDDDLVWARLFLDYDFEELMQAWEDRGISH